MPFDRRSFLLGAVTTGAAFAGGMLMPDIEFRSAQNIARRPTHGIGRIFSNDMQPGGSGALSHLYKREAEAPFLRARLCIYSRETSVSTGWTAVIAPTETPLADTPSRRYQPISAGVAQNVAYGVSNPHGWRPVTLAGATALSVPAQKAPNRPSVMRSDWVDCASIPRTDGSLRHLLLARVYHNGGAGNTHTLISGPKTGTGLNAWNSAPAQAEPYYRQFRSAQFNGDAAGTLGNMPAGGFEDSNWPFWLDFEFDYAVPTRSVMCVGDSTYAAGGFQPYDFAQWLVQACGRKSTPQAPIHAFNGAQSSQSVAVFRNYLADMIGSGVIPTDVVIPVGSPNDSNDAAFSPYLTSRNKAYVLDMLDLCDSIGARMFLATRIPNDQYSAANANEDQRLALNAWARQLCQDNPDRLTLVDFDAVLSNGAYPARFNTGFRGDDFHQSAAGIAVMADAFHALL